MKNMQLMKSHKLSIIVPHYNSSDLLEKLLSTIPKDKNIEVIVVDDKSEDKHINYIQNMKKSKKYTDFILLKNETSKKGAGTARNIGLEKANGEWILFADSDDYFTDIFYESVSKYFDSKNEVVFFRPTSIYIDTGEVADRHIYYMKILDNYKKEPNPENELLIRYALPIPWSKLIKNDFLNKNNIVFDEIIASNDVMFSTKVGYFMEKFEVVDEVIYVVTKNHGSLTVNLREEVFDARFNAIISRYHFLKDNLSEEDFRFFSSLNSTRTYIIKSTRYGIIKLFKTLVIIYRNDMKFFHYKLLNPLYLLTKTLQYRSDIKKSEKYTVNK